MLTVCLRKLCPQDSSAHACRTVNAEQTLSPGGWKNVPGVVQNGLLETSGGLWFWSNVGSGVSCGLSGGRGGLFLIWAAK